LFVVKTPVPADVVFFDSFSLSIPGYSRIIPTASYTYLNPKSVFVSVCRHRYRSPGHGLQRDHERC
jgi:hypothetical protein